jgi:transcription elongation factor GreA
MEKIPLTRAGYDKLDAELRHLKSVERPEIIAAIAEARAHGDLSENAEYHSAKEKQSFIEGRIKELEGVISLAEVIDTSKLSGPIKFGAVVRLVDENTTRRGPTRSWASTRPTLRTAAQCPKPARALAHCKTVGDSVEVRTPGGEKSYEVLRSATPEARPSTRHLDAA